MSGAFTICTGMYGSGWKTAIMTAMRAHLLMEVRGSLRRDAGVCGVVVCITALQGVSIPRLATFSPPISGAKVMVFELSGIFDPLSFTSLLLLGKR